MIPARILHEIEKKTNRSISQLFDLIVGTSTGGILAACLTAPKPVSAEQLIDLYVQHGNDIFHRSFWKGVSSVAGVFDEKYSADALERILEGHLRRQRLRNSKPDIIVTAYDIERRQPYLFKSSAARAKEKGRDHLLRDVARATSAAPTYFEPLNLECSPWFDENGSRQDRRALIDGGVFANNPTMIALSEALASGSGVDEVLLCSIGTGVHERPIYHREAKDWGLAMWARPVLSVMMDGMSDSADYLARQLLGKRYYRFDGELAEAMDDMDNASRGNVSNLLSLAEEIIADNQQDLDDLMRELSR